MVRAFETGRARRRADIAVVQFGHGRLLLKFFEGQPGLGTLIKLAPVRDMAEFETTLAGIAATPGSSVIIPADPFISSNGAAIVQLVERFKLPAVYTYRQLAVVGGLMPYGPDTFAAFHHTPHYRPPQPHGEPPPPLPSQAPTKSHLALKP